MKKIASIVGSIAILTSTFSPAFAAGNNCGNGTTGPISYNTCSVTNSSDVSVVNTNNATINNNLTELSRSGGNSASMNTLGGSVVTGNASAHGTVSNVANVNTTTVSGGPAASGNTGTNDVTGPESDNRVSINNSHRVAVANINNANVSNVMSVTSDAGGNVADTNTGPASIRTGNSSLQFVLENHLNDSATGISAGAGGTGGNSGGNGTTGPISYNTVDVNNVATAGVSNINNLSLSNLMNTLSRSGANSASTNTLGGEIVTGGAASSVGVNNEGNIATTTVQMALGGFSNVSGNDVTGPLSDNRTNLLNTLGINVANVNNNTANNVVNDVADSGSNVSNMNTGGGSVTAGMSDLLKTLLNHFNDSLTVIQQ